MSTAESLPPRVQKIGDTFGVPVHKTRPLLSLVPRQPWEVAEVYCLCSPPRDLTIAAADRWWDETCTEGLTCTSCGNLR